MLIMVPAAGVEPARALAHYPLKIACLPVPPRRLILVVSTPAPLAHLLAARLHRSG